MTELGKLTAADFEPLLKTEFVVKEGDQSFPFRLEKITRLDGCSPVLKREPFSLLFYTPPGLRIPQRIYTLTHPVLGELDLFLVQLGASPDYCTVEAVFN